MKEEGKIIKSNCPYKVLHPFTFMPGYENVNVTDISNQYISIAKGKGSWVYDKEGKAYLYTTTAVPSVGLGNDEIINHITNQYKKLSFASTCAQTHNLINELAERLIKICGDNYGSVFFSNDGSGAVETAMKLARQYFLSKGNNTRTKFLSLEGNYHGTTFGSGSVTHMGIKETFGPDLEDCYSAPAPNLYRPPIEGTEKEIIEYCILELEKQIEDIGANTIAAVLLEPIQGVNGIVVLPEEYITAVRQITKKYGILLIMDEVATGIGRTGNWLASHHYNVQSDLLALSKGITGGYFPMGVTVMSNEIIQQLVGNGGIFLHGSTQSGHPIGCAAALAVLDFIEEKGLIENTRTKGNHILNKLREEFSNTNFVGDIRGMGFMISMEFVNDKVTKEPLSFEYGEELTRILHENGLLGNYFNGNLIMYPPLTLSDNEMEYLINKLIITIQKFENYMKERKSK